MKLLNVKIEGFRNIESDSIEFGNGITSLVSTNSYGKSNLMLAIDFAVDFIKADEEMKAAMMSWVNGIPFNRYVESHNFVADFLFSALINGVEYNINYGYEFVWIKNKGGKQIVKEWLNVREDGKSQKFTRLINRDGKALYKSAPTGRCSSVIHVSDSELVINRLLLEESLYYIELIKILHSVKVHLERHLDASLFYLKDPFVLKEQEELDLSNISSVPRTIFQLKNRYPDKYAILENAFEQLFPNITAIDVKEINIGEHHDIKISGDAPYTISNKVYSMFIQDRNLNQPIDFRSLSDGAKRVFLMLTCTIIADIEGITLIEIEEPENSIHPGLLQSYLTVVSQLAGQCRIIVASHSPYIIQYVSTEDIYIGKPNDRGIADFARIEGRKIKQLMKDASSESNSIGDYIFELLSGGEDEMEILMNYLEK
jgi:predicted ATPase